MLRIRSVSDWEMIGLNKVVGLGVIACLLSLPSMAQRGGGRKGPTLQIGSGQHRGPHFGDWLRKNLNTPPAQQQKALENDPKFKKLSPEHQERLKRRLEKFNALPPDQQQRILDRMEKWEHMTPEQHQKARELMDRMRALPEERRTSIRQQMHAFTTMTLDQRNKFMGSDQYKKEFSPDEQDLMRQWLDFRDRDTESATPSPDDPQK